MSTRANIKIISENGQSCLYKHFDGYIKDGLGDFLKTHISDILSYNNCDECKEYIKSLYNSKQDRNEIDTIDDTDNEHGDNKYLYVINLNSKEFDMYRVKYKYYNDNPLNYTKTYHLIK